jgi:hypothetical protein
MKDRHYLLPFADSAEFVGQNLIQKNGMLITYNLTAKHYEPTTTRCRRFVSRATLKNPINEYQ